MPMKPVDTAIVVSVGPLIDDSDFVSLETALPYNAAGMSVDLFIETAEEMTKTDLTLTILGANDWAHRGNGVYELELTAAQNDTEGVLWVVGICDGVLVFESPRYQVVPANVYDSLVAGSDTLQVDGETQLRSGTAQAGGASTITLDAGASAVNDFFKHCILAITGGTGAGQSQVIDSYVGSTKVATMAAAWATAPDNSSVFVVLPLGTIPGATAPSAAVVSAAVWDKARASHDSAGSFGEGLSNAHAAVANKRTTDRNTHNMTVFEDDNATPRITRQVQEVDADTQGVVPI